MGFSVFDSVGGPLNEDQSRLLIVVVTIKGEPLAFQVVASLTRGTWT